MDATDDPGSPRSHTKEYEFEATIEQGRSGSAWVHVPLDVKKKLGSGGRLRVIVTFDGESSRGAVETMDKDVHVLRIRKAIRRQIGKDIGDRVKVVVSKDNAGKTVVLPDELRTALKRHPTARVMFAKLSYTDRREHAAWVAEGTDTAARRKRAVKTLAKILKTTN